MELLEEKYSFFTLRNGIKSFYVIKYVSFFVLLFIFFCEPFYEKEKIKIFM